MAAIPTIPGSAMVRTLEANVRMDSGVMQAPAAGAREVARAVGDAGAMLGSFAVKMQEAVNFGITADVDRTLRAASAEFQASRQGRTDEDQWTAEWKEKSDAVWSGIQEKHAIAPGMRARMTAMFKDWQQSNAIEVQTMANKQRINRATERVGLAIDEAARDGDELSIKAVIKGAVESHILMPEVAQKVERDALTKIDEYAGRNYIMNNPAGAVDFIEEKDKAGKYVNLTRLDPNQRLTLINTARVQFTKFQEENYKGIFEELQQGQTRTPDQLEALVKTKVISPQQRKSYERAYRQGNYNVDVGEQADLFSALYAYDPAKDPTFKQRAELNRRMVTSGFPTEVLSQMFGVLKEKANGASSLNGPVAKDVFKAIEERFDLGLYGKFKIPYRDEQDNWRVKTDAAVFERATGVKMRVMDGLRKFLAANPTASADDANRYVSQLQMNEVVKSGRASVGEFIGTSDVPESMDDIAARLDALLEKGKKGK